ncbi:hypothetical protein BRADI_2g18242v3 [Brachypodium distachyon]|uniref:Uncharacterized protein n=1 Tax=Brachypodium distachyon TaxID=15368 RepID=A0A2K2D958_BRADI|nr:hypothetical protein BRADI_2g18242v3 [Brachypodium distachyon]
MSAGVSRSLCASRLASSDVGDRSLAGDSLTPESGSTQRTATSGLPEESRERPATVLLCCFVSFCDDGLMAFLAVVDLFRW